MRTRLALLASAALAALLGTAPAAQASCLLATVVEQRARAQVIFVGVALEGPTATGVQRFRVSKYLKGVGPSIVRVRTGTTRRAAGTGSTTSVSLLVKRGERWLIFARRSGSRILTTTLCDGSRRR